MAKEILTYERFIELALENYENGGDGYYECTDRKDWEKYRENYPKTEAEALAQFKLSAEIERDMRGWF